MLELEVYKRCYILASELKDKLHDNDEDCKLNDPGPANKALAEALPPAIGHGVREDKHKHKDTPRKAHIDKDGEVVEVEVGKEITEHNPQIAKGVDTEDGHCEYYKAYGDEPRHKLYDACIGYALE